MMMSPHTRTATTKTIGVVLAGGRSTRMGTDKAALRIDNESLLQRAQRVLQEAGCERVVLSGHPRTEWHGDCVPDQFPGAGPVGGIISALRWATALTGSGTAVLFVPVDAPRLSPALLARLLHSDSSNEGCVVTGSPLPIMLRPSDAVLKQASIAAMDLQTGLSWSVKRFIEPLKLTPIEADDTIRSLLVNVNTPAQWEDLCREFENCS